MKQFNIYYGTINSKLPVKYRFTKKFNSQEEAIQEAFEKASNVYYKNEGHFGIPDYGTINSESEITGLSIEELYKEHIMDMCRWYVIPTEEDTISSKKLVHYY